jgi:hypothetical protein
MSSPEEETKPTVTPEAATAVVELLMINLRTF